MNQLESGQVIAGRYQITALLGQGGMATVYKVWDNQRAAHLALKLLRADLAEDRVFLRRFTREAEVLEQLQHPGIVRFYGFEQYEREAFMLLEYVEGDTLRGRIFDAGGPLPLAEVLWWLRPICGALHYAHNLSVAHCDIKPANMMVTRDGRMYLADFGIARLAESATTTAWNPGTPAYMSPEQCRGEELDPRTDIYSLGVTLYEMVTGGERPFTGDTQGTTGSIAERIRWQHFFETPPLPRRYNPDLPLEVETVITRCLAKRREDRWPGALPLLRALEAASGGVEISGAPAGVAATRLPRAAPVISVGAPPQTFPASSLPVRGTAPAPVSGPRPQGLAVMVGALVLLLALVGGLFALNSGGRERPTPSLAALTSTPPVVAFVETPTATVTVQPTVTPEPSPTPTLEPTPTAIQTVVTYTVQLNDTLWDIAMRFEVSGEALAAANDIFGERLWPGQVLIIPVAVKLILTPTPVPVARKLQLGAHIMQGFIHNDYLRYADMTWIRMTLNYPEDPYNYIATSHANGFKAQISALASSSMVTEAGFEEKFAQWVAIIAVAGADSIEIWYEPNLDRAWDYSRMSPQNYTNLLCHSYAAIKAANPGSEVIAAAMAPTNAFGSGCNCIDRGSGQIQCGCDDLYFLQGMYEAGATNCMDNIGAQHISGATSPAASSGHPADPTSTHRSWFFLKQTHAYYNIFGGLHQIVYTRLGYFSPEGYRSVPDSFSWGADISAAQQAQWLGEAARLSQESGMVSRLIIWNIGAQCYEICAGVQEPQAGYNIIRPGGACPACEVLKSVLER